MRRFFLPLSILAVVVSVACSEEPRDPERAKPGAAPPAAAALVVPHEAADLMDRPETLVLDVRTPAEWDRGRLPGAVRIGIDRLPQALAAGEISASPDRPILVYCAVGIRSARAAELLASRGFTAVHDLHGGIQAWSMSGLPVER